MRSPRRCSWCRRAIIWIAVLAGCGTPPPDPKPVAPELSTQPSPAADHGPFGRSKRGLGAPEDLEPERPLLGVWCLQFHSAALEGAPKVPDGSKWEFHPDHTFDYERNGERRTGRWRYGGRYLGLFQMGDYDVIELTADSMVLSGEGYRFFGRDCGPEYAKFGHVSALVLAAGDGDLAKVQQAIDSGVDVNAVDEVGPIQQTPLMAAARNGRLEVVDLLLRKGARYDFETSLGETAMSLAESGNHSAVMARLSRAGAPRTATLIEERQRKLFGPR